MMSGLRSGLSASTKDLISHDPLRSTGTLLRPTSYAGAFNSMCLKDPSCVVTSSSHRRTQPSSNHTVTKTLAPSQNASTTDTPFRGPERIHQRSPNSPGLHLPPRTHNPNSYGCAILHRREAAHIFRVPEPYSPRAVLSASVRNEVDVSSRRCCTAIHRTQQKNATDARLLHAMSTWCKSK
jgi:hypothetical protein